MHRSLIKRMDILPLTKGNGNKRCTNALLEETLKLH